MTSLRIHTQKPPERARMRVCSRDRARRRKGGRRRFCAGSNTWFPRTIRRQNKKAGRPGTRFTTEAVVQRGRPIAGIASKCKPCDQSPGIHTGFPLRQMDFDCRIRNGTWLASGCRTPARNDASPSAVEPCSRLSKRAVYYDSAEVGLPVSHDRSV